MNGVQMKIGQVATGLVLLTLVGCVSAEDLSAEGESNSEVVEASDDEPDREDEGGDGGTASDEEGDAAGPAPDHSEPPPEEDDRSEQSTPERVDLEVADSGFSTYRAYDDSERVSWGVVLHNPNEAWLATSVDATVTYLDGDDSILGSSSDTVAAILPGQDAALAESTFEDIGAVDDIRVQIRAGDWEEVEESVGTFETDDVNVRPQEFGGWTVTGSVASTFVDDFEDVYAVAILRDGEGAIVGGGWTFLDFVPGNGDTSFEIGVLDDIADVDHAEVHVNFSSLSLW